MKNWILAARPKTLFASIGPVILGLACASFTTGTINISIAILTLCCALLLQIGSNLANDYLDYVRGVDNENRLGPIRVTSAGLIDQAAMKTAVITVLIAAFLLGIFLMYSGGPFIIAIGLLSLYFSYGYTGGPFPLSYNGLGEVAAFIFFGPVAVVGTAYLQTHEITRTAVLAGFGPGFISACILAVNNLRDIQSDLATNKRTIAVRFGEKFQRYLCVCLISLSMLLGVYLVVNLNLGPLMAFSFVILPLIFHKTWLSILYAPIDGKLNLCLQRTAQYNLLFCLLLSISLIAHAR
jgi:1,4-dihydroxy-2-naphthoate polyprenyltransferase